MTTGGPARAISSCLARTLAVLPQLKAKLTAQAQRAEMPIGKRSSICAPSLRARLDAALVEDCPLVGREGGFIRHGFRRAARRPARAGHAAASNGSPNTRPRKQPAPASPNLKVGFNNVFGYYLEITNTHTSTKFPTEYIRKQTVKNAERYITPELKEYEEKVLSADERSKQLGVRTVPRAARPVAAAARRLRSTAAVLAQLDVLAALADLARQAELLPADDRRRAGA